MKKQEKYIQKSDKAVRPEIEIVKIEGNTITIKCKKIDLQWLELNKQKYLIVWSN